MNRKYIIWIIPGVIAIGVLSVIAGLKMGKTPEIQKPSPSPTEYSDYTEVSTQTQIPDPEEEYTIILKEGSLVLYENDKKLNETKIAAHVLPYGDIEALESGLVYHSLENALIDWESLCK